jgi:hypothetical protein
VDLQKEAEMKAIKLAGVILALSAVSVMASDGVVTWNVSMTAPGTGVGGVPQVAATDSYIEFFVNVGVTGNNKGLASFQNDMRIRKVSTDTNVNGNPSLTWGNYYKNSKGFKSPATGVRGVVTDGGMVGGPGLDVLPSLGIANATGFIDDIGTGILDWDPLRLNAKGSAWEGKHQWGVGLDSRKAELLVDPAGDYMVNYGYWNVANFLAANGEGLYKIEILPVGASVLSAEADLTVPGSGVTTTLAGGDIVGESFVFQVGDVPEPATLLLLAGAGAFIRRRRHA